MLVAPASADVIARLAQGRADDLLSALSLASESPLAIAPAMNNKMWSNQATMANLEVLRSRGVQVLGPASGDQACGEQGEGRLLEPMDIVAEMNRLLVPKKLQGKRVLITAGPTFEPIDPVRFIGNRSSGKMGFAVAQAAVEAGAEVTLIAGPVHLATPTGVNRIDVETAQVMYENVMAKVGESDIFISCAAVADYRPVEWVKNKIKKTDQNTLSIELEPTLDIVADVARQEDKPFVVGFAAETQDVTAYAQEKLQRKGLDMIAANQVGNGLGFAVDQNALAVFWPNGNHTLELASKAQLARDLMTLIIEQYDAKNTTKTA
ncbi:MAG: bifunctional phosphopantothenoylcysteine decarboxylase/phosphopantothenate--cysteine ligase CoaBC [Gammaproteobacteria bacterium]|nr:MAG: bifunctional phosphopantothenoylcysteine decarboxylase/phosphopantothenate--cysteine ligase CoaBC [Gammaproteobacteria bacterium]